MILLLLKNEIQAMNINEKDEDATRRFTHKRFRYSKIFTKTVPFDAWKGGSKIESFSQKCILSRHIYNKAYRKVPNNFNKDK